MHLKVDMKNPVNALAGYKVNLELSASTEARTLVSEGIALPLELLCYQTKY